jgi:diacylglycerol kinase (ATP)
MKHIFIVNTVAGEHSCLDEVMKAIANESEVIDYEVFTPNSAKDNISQIKSYLEAHPDEEVRFYACGGDGTINKVASGIYGYPNASMTVLAYGSGNDYIKYFADLQTFRDVEKVMHGTEKHVDIMQTNDRYALNATHFGLDSKVAKTMNIVRRYPIIGGKMCYPIAVFWAFLTGMRTKCTVYADGEKLNDGKICLCTIANGRYVGGSYKCAPRSSNEDGLLEVCLIKPISRLKFMQLKKSYTVGKHLDDPKFKDIIVYRRAKQVVIEATKEFCVSIDGEILHGEKIVVENKQQAIRFVVPTI